MMEPLKMNPVFKDNIWGGSRLKDEYGKATPYGITGESWEVASHQNGESTVCGGVYAGKTIRELTVLLKEKLLGDKMYKGTDEKFPLLIKFIDARESLSVQVHPDDQYANANENGEFGKTEMWYIMDAAEGAGIIYGFNETITKEKFREAIENNTLLEYTYFAKCRKGDSFFIPAGTLHAIGEGLLIAEIQQNSDTTYRVYDYDRRDAAGNTRELHIDKAVDVTNLSPADCKDSQAKEDSVLADCKYFKVEKLTLNGEMDWKVSRERFEVLIVCEGNIKINDTEFKKGETALVPAYIGQLFLKGNGVVLRTYVNV